MIMPLAVLSMGEVAPPMSSSIPTIYQASGAARLHNLSIAETVVENEAPYCPMTSLSPLQLWAQSTGGDGSTSQPIILVGTQVDRLSYMHCNGREK